MWKIEDGRWKIELCYISEKPEARSQKPEARSEKQIIPYENSPD